MSLPTPRTFALVCWGLVLACGTAPAEPDPSVSEYRSTRGDPPSEAPADRQGGGSAPARAQTDESPPGSGVFQLGTPELLRKTDASPTEVLEYAGVEPVDHCQPFKKRKTLERRRDQWLAGIRLLARTYPEVAYGWLTGRRRPPELAIDEVLQRHNCMVDDLFRRARNSGPALRIEFELGDREIRDPDEVREWTESYFRDAGVRSRLRDAVTISYLRTASEQAEIWGRKAEFRGPEFDRITSSAADECGLEAGRPWEPERDDHEECWREELGPRDRAREILSASSAPGLSRHHWGTEVDLFDISRSVFRAGGRHHDAFVWLRSHAPNWGFYQCYGPRSEAYLEERWHWSYFPIASALETFVSNHPEAFEGHLRRLWDRLDRTAEGEPFGRTASFEYVLDRWKSYVFGVSRFPKFGADEATVRR